MKVLIVNSHIPWGGLGQFSITLARGLAGQSGYKIYGLVTHSDGGRYRDFSGQTRKTVFVGNFPKFLKHLVVLSHIWRLKPDVIIINYNATVHFLLPLLPRIPVITVIHSDDPDYYRTALINQSLISAWVCPTPKTKQGLIAHAGNARLLTRIQVIPHGVTESSPFDKVLSMSTFNIVFVGALYEHKGVDLLPRILSGFMRNYSDFTLTIIGDGPLYESLAHEFSNLCFKNRVTLTGVLDSDKVRGIMRRSDVLLFPTRLEGFGLVVIEAMMEGCVPVVTNLNGITDSIIEHDESGLLVDKNDVPGFVNSLSKLYENRKLLQAMSKQSASIAVSKFSQKRMTEDYQILINKISTN